MPTLKYVGPIDEIDCVGVGVLKRGEEFEATAEQAKSLLDQPDMYQPATKKKG